MPLTTDQGSNFISRYEIALNKKEMEVDVNVNSGPCTPASPGQGSTSDKADEDNIFLQTGSTVEHQKKWSTGSESSVDGKDPSLKCSLSSGEKELLKATNPSTRATRSQRTARSNWKVPDTDSEDEFGLQQQRHSNNGKTRSNAPIREHFRPRTTGPNRILTDSDEDPYSFAKSPTSSISSIVPPPPPPIASMPAPPWNAPPKASMLGPPWNTAAPLTTTTSTDAGKSYQRPDTLPIAKPNIETEAKVIHRNKPRRSLPRIPSASSDPNPYDYIDDEEEQDMKSQPRYNFKKAKITREAQANSSPSKDYAQVKKTAWNFPSSDEEDEAGTSFNKLGAPNHMKLSRQSSTTSSDGERPAVPPKLWEAESSDGEAIELRRNSSDSGIRESSRENLNRNQVVETPERLSESDASATCEYSLLQPGTNQGVGSLIGANDCLPSPNGSQSSGFEDNQEFVEVGSITSKTSSKGQTDLEQSTVDMDQLSLDSPDSQPRRIVETHEVHEIVPGDDTDDDVIERIIKTETITEKLEQKPFKQLSSEDLSKYLNNDDEFVSHIFTLGRTIERGKSRKSRDHIRDFAFVQNPFGGTDQQIESMPIEKKTVKQKITTLVKKKRNFEENNIYAEVTVTPTTPEPPEPRSRSGTQLSQMDQRSPNASSNHIAAFSDEHPNGLYASGEIPTDTRSLDSSPKSKTKDIRNDKKPSLLKGLRKFWKRKERYGIDKNNTVEMDDDYQEFVP